MEPSSLRRIVLLGATGSIGQSTLHVIRAHPQRFTLIGAAADRSKQQLEALAQAFPGLRTSLYCEQGEAGLMELATLEDADVVVVATTGTVAMQATLAALHAGKTVALASKEIIVTAGARFMQAATGARGTLLPVDSEHNAIFQCLNGKDPATLRRVILTASGGPFLNWTAAEMRHITVKDALRHPTWEMGAKITVDSATLANKGLELMEARWLFDLQPQQLAVVIHPQSTVHAMVEFVDGSVIAQMAEPDMSLPIQFAIDYPMRRPAPLPALDFSRILRLDFRPPDEVRFPCLALARSAMQTDGCAPAVFNIANQVAVQAFIDQRISFAAIPKLIDCCLQQIDRFGQLPDLPRIPSFEEEIRQFAQAQLETLPNELSSIIQ
jgi:1-deoxy-D-xylulose-5-phosphate reductoisomerase